LDRPNWNWSQNNHPGYYHDWTDRIKIELERDLEQV
jgi:hypothetical protein